MQSIITLSTPYFCASATPSFTCETTTRLDIAGASGSCGFEFFYDPALAGHKALTELIRVPQDEDWRITFADDDASTWSFTGAGFTLGGTVALNSGLKGSAKIKLDGIPTYPSGGSAD